MATHTAQWSQLEMNILWSGRTQLQLQANNSIHGYLALPAIVSWLTLSRIFDLSPLPKNISVASPSMLVQKDNRQRSLPAAFRKGCQRLRTTLRLLRRYKLNSQQAQF
eukprot:8930-Heterococcus_DN1.PRE.2